jgi:hypothetical protein
MGFRNRLNFPPGSITNAMLADGSVTGPKLSFDAIDGKVITGALIRTDAPPNERWELTSAAANQLVAYTGLPGEVSPGGVICGPGAGQIALRHPTTGIVTPQGELAVRQSDPGGNSEIHLLSTNGGYFEDPIIPANTMYWHDGQLFKDLLWTNLPLLNSWVQDSVNTTPQYIKDAAGNVWIRGAIKNGTTSVVGILPAGYRPSQGMEFPPLRATAGAGTFATVTIAGNGTITINTNLVSAQTRLVLALAFSATP